MLRLVPLPPRDRKTSTVNLKDARNRTSVYWTHRFAGEGIQGELAPRGEFPEPSQVVRRGRGPFGFAQGRLFDSAYLNPGLYWLHVGACQQDVLPGNLWLPDECARLREGCRDTFAAGVPAGSDRRRGGGGALLTPPHFPPQHPTSPSPPSPSLTRT